MIDVETVTWRNFLGYGDYVSAIDLRTCRGVCMIEGEHEENIDRDEGDEKLNNSGKTSIIEALTWGIFGRLTRDNPQNRGDKVINWHTGKNCIVTIDTSDGYQISRMRKFKSMTETIIMKDGEDATRSTNTPVQDFIDNIFDINYDTFIRSRVFGQFNTGFMELSEIRMRKVLEWLMNIHHLGPRAKTAKNKVDECIKRIDRLNDQIERTKKDIESIKTEIGGLADSSNSFKDKIRNDIDNLKSKLVAHKTKAEEEVKSIHEEISTKQKERNTLTEIDISELLKRWDEYEKQQEYIKSLENTISCLTGDVKNLERSLLEPINEDRHIKLIEEFNNHQRQLIEKQGLLTKLIKASERIKVKIENDQEFLSIEHKPVCSECRQKIPKGHLEAKREEAKTRISELSEQHDKSKSSIKKIEKQIATLAEKTAHRPQQMVEVQEHNNLAKEWLERLNAKKEELVATKRIEFGLLRIEKPGISVQEAESNNKYRATISEAILDRQNRAKEITDNFKRVAIEISEEIKKTRQRTNPYQELIADRNKRLREMDEERIAKTKELAKLKTLKDHLDYIRESYGNKRKIKAFWISELIPEFNKYLDYYQDFFEVTNKVKFDELLAPKMDKWGFHTSSGGECKRIDLSIMFALNDLHVSNFGPQSNFMVLDEVDGRLDPFTMNRLVSLLNDDLINRDDGLTNIFVISHRKEMKDRFPNKIRVKYKQEKSYIING